MVFMYSMNTDIKDILHSFDNILGENKKSIMEVTDVYNNIDFKDGVVGNSAPSRDNINTALLADVETAARNAGVKVDVTTAITGHHTGKTRHTSGNAVDIAIINGKSVSTSNRADADKLVNQLISLGYVKNSETSNNKAVLTFGFPGHDNHVHVSNLTGAASTEQTPAASTTGTTQTAPATGDTPTQNATPANDDDDVFGVSKIDDNDVMFKKAREMAGQFGLKEEIIESFESILERKKSLLQEVALAAPLNSVKVNSGFGPRWGTSHNGVDLAANAEKVKAPADGVVEIGEIKNDACGGTIVISHADGFKTGFCHMQKIDVRAGQQVKQGDVIGTSGGGKNDPGRGRSDGRHLHFTLRQNGKLLNPVDYINKSGIFMKGDAPKSSTDSTTKDSISDMKPDSVSSSTFKKPEKDDDVFGTNKIDYNDIMFKMAKELASKFGLNEEKVYGTFGDRLSDRFGSIIIPSRSNPKIKSPVDGVIYSTHTDSNCKNQVVIEHEINNTINYLQFCNITEPNTRDGQKISKGTTLGKTSDDVRVSLYDSGWGRRNLVSMMDIEIKTPIKSKVNSKKEKDNDDDKDKDVKEPTKYYDPSLPFFFKKINDMIPSISKNKKGEEPKISNFFNKYSLSNKKVNEDIERIKRLL